MKNNINFNNINDASMAQLKAFKEAARDLAYEDIRFKSELKTLKSNLEAIIAQREKAIAEGMTVDEAASAFSRVEADNAIRKAQRDHEEICTPFRMAMKATYTFIPDTMYDSYTKKINEHKRGDFLNDIKAFLGNLGIEGCKQGQVSKFAETMSDMFGARYASAKKVIENNIMHTTMSKTQFNKLFMAVFCDMFIND